MALQPNDANLQGLIQGQQVVNMDGNEAVLQELIQDVLLEVDPVTGATTILHRGAQDAPLLMQPATMGSNPDVDDTVQTVTLDNSQDTNNGTAYLCTTSWEISYVTAEEEREMELGEVVTVYEGVVTTDEDVGRTGFGMTCEPECSGMVNAKSEEDVDAPLQMQPAIMGSNPDIDDTAQQTVTLDNSQDTKKFTTYLCATTGEISYVAVEEESETELEEVWRVEEEGVRVDEEVVRDEEEVVRVDEEGVRVDEEVMRVDEEGVRNDEEGVRDDVWIVRVDKKVVRAHKKVVTVKEEVVTDDEEARGTASGTTCEAEHSGMVNAKSEGTQKDVVDDDFVPTKEGRRGPRVQKNRKRGRESEEENEKRKKHKQAKVKWKEKMAKKGVLKEYMTERNQRYWLNLKKREEEGEVCPDEVAARKQRNRDAQRRRRAAEKALNPGKTRKTKKNGVQVSIKVEMDFEDDDHNYTKRGIHQ